MNKLKTNYHTHTNFCDGKESPEEIVKAAIQKKINIIGFSGHSMFPFSSDWHIAGRQYKIYVEEIRRLAKIYDDQIEILCGFEGDWLPPLSVPTAEHYEPLNPDYLIGSVHYIVTKNGQFTVDDKAENVLAGVNFFFNGDARAAVCEYFSLEREMVRHGGFHILGHCDLFRKRNGELKLFNENEEWYRNELRATAKEIAKSGVIAEINTGAIGRGSMKSCYPSDEMLSLLHDSHVPITINSDAHSSEHLDCAFDFAKDVAIKAGYSESMFLTRGNGGIEIKSQPL